MTEKIELIRGQDGIALPFSGGNWVFLRDKGYSPVQMLVAAAGACGAYVYESILTKSHVPFTFHGVTVDYVRDESAVSQPVKKIDITFEVSVEESYQGKAERILKLVAKHCPVIQSLDPAIQIQETVAFR